MNKPKKSNNWSNHSTRLVYETVVQHYSWLDDFIGTVIDLANTIEMEAGELYWKKVSPNIAKSVLISTNWLEIAEFELKQMGVKDLYVGGKPVVVEL